MAADFEMKAGDTLPSLRAYLSDPHQGDTDEERVVDLTDATGVQLRMKRGGQVVLQAAMSIVVPELGSIQYDWQPGDTARPGKYQVEFVVTFAGGKERTFPSADWEHVLVSPRL